MLLVGDALLLGGRRLDVGGPRREAVHKLAVLGLHHQLRASAARAGSEAPTGHTEPDTDRATVGYTRQVSSATAEMVDN